MGFELFVSNGGKVSVALKAWKWRGNNALLIGNGIRSYTMGFRSQMCVSSLEFSQIENYVKQGWNAWIWRNFKLFCVVLDAFGHDKQVFTCIGGPKVEFHMISNYKVMT